MQPNTLPAQYVAPLRQVIQDEIAQGLPKLRLRVLYAPPPKARKGDIAYADGTGWNPGDGPGAYQFDGTNWQLLWSDPNVGVPGGASGTVQFNNAGVFDGIPGSDWTGDTLELTAGDAALPVLKLILAAAHTGTGFELRSSADALLFSLTATGAAVLRSISLSELSANILAIRNSLGGHAAFNLLETPSGSVPATPGSNQMTSYITIVGGKMQWQVKFGSGAVQVIATEP